MNVFRRFLRLPLACAVTCLAACEHGGTPVARDTTSGVHPSGAAAPPGTPAATTWDRGAGSLLLVATDTASRAYVVAPDTATERATFAAVPHAASVTLFGRSGTVQSAELDSITVGDACAVGDLRAAPPPRPWSVGFFGGVVSPLPVDTAGALSRGDSTAIVIEMNRLASALPNDSAGRFTGLPFVVRGVWRFSPAGGPQVVVAELERQLNQEASPLAERTLLITERGAKDTSFATVYSERSYGNEETIESDDVLAALLVGDAKTPAIVLSSDFGDSLAYALLERTGDGRWARRWSSTRRHC